MSVTDELLFQACAIAPVLALAAVSIAIRRRRGRPAWAQIAASCGLAPTLAQRHLPARCLFQGERDGLQVRVLDRISGLTVVEVDGLGLIPRAIDLRSEFLPANDVEIGDEYFDRDVVVRGQRPALLALLDPEMRRLLHGLVISGGRVRDGCVIAPVPGNLNPRSPADAPALCRLITSAHALAARLVMPKDLVGLLCERVRQETHPGVRRSLVATLAQLLGADGRPHPLLRDALGADDQEQRLRAAVVLGSEGRSVLLDIASHAEGDNQQAVQAVNALGRHLPLERALAFLDDALALDRPQVAAALIHTLGDIAGSEAVRRLAGVLSRPDSLADAAAAALASTSDPEAEPPLLGALSAAPAGRRLALVRALARVGSASAVPQLRSLAADPDRELARAAREAVAAIHARLTGAAPGQISLAETSAGQVSIVSEHAAGSVSLVREPTPMPRPPEPAQREEPQPLSADAAQTPRDRPARRVTDA